MERQFERCLAWCAYSYCSTIRVIQIEYADVESILMLIIVPKEVVPQLEEAV